MEQLLLHLFGDYILQSAWMADHKTKRDWPALVHALVYSLPFLLITGWLAWSVIFVTHFFIDRYRLARFVIYFKNIFGSAEFWSLQWHSIPSWAECERTGYPASMPIWLATWLLIIADNTLHLGLNYLAIRFLGAA